MQEKMKKSTLVSYGLCMATGRQFITALVATYILVFFTDTFGLSAATAGGIMFAATIWDAINDIIIGNVVDRTKTRWGRYRPYMLFVPPLLAIVSVFLFAAPDLSPNGKVFYGAVFYVLYGMLLTALEIPNNALLPAITTNEKERTGSIQVYTFIASITILVVTSFTLNFVITLGKGNDAKGYMLLVAIAGVVMVLTNWLSFATSKEKYVKEKAQSSVWNDFKKLLKIKEIFPLLIVWAMGYLGFQVMMSSSVYYMIYYIHRPDLISSYMLMLSIGGMIGITVLLPLCMRYMKGLKNSFIITQIIVAVSYVLLFFFGGYSITVLFVLSFVSAIFSTMVNAYIPMLCVEATDFAAYKLDENINATIAAIKGFSYKCGNALASGSLAMVMALTGYAANQDQTALALTGINAGRFIIPALASLIVVIALKFYPITNDIKAKMNEARDN